MAAPGRLPTENSTIEILIDVWLLGLLAVTAIVILRVRELFAAAMMSGLFSLLAAALYVTLDAVDVAFTEAAVGAGIATILMLGTLALTAHEQRSTPARPWASLLVVLLTGAALVYGTMDMPHFADPGAAAHAHVAPRYLEASPVEIGIPNVVTSVLASYRGYDTLGEVAVIFTAGVAVLGLLGRGRRRARPGFDDGNPREDS